MVNNGPWSSRTLPAFEAVLSGVFVCQVVVRDSWFFLPTATSTPTSKWDLHFLVKHFWNVYSSTRCWCAHIGWSTCMVYQFAFLFFIFCTLDSSASCLSLHSTAPPWLTIASSHASNENRGLAKGGLCRVGSDPQLSITQSIQPSLELCSPDSGVIANEAGEEDADVDVAGLAKDVNVDVANISSSVNGRYASSGAPFVCDEGITSLFCSGLWEFWRPCMSGKEWSQSWYQWSKHPTIHLVRPSLSKKYCALAYA